MKLNPQQQALLVRMKAKARDILLASGKGGRNRKKPDWQAGINMGIQMRPYHCYVMDKLVENDLVASYSNAVQSALELAGEELGLSEEEFGKNTDVNREYVDRLRSRRSNKSREKPE